MAWRVVKQPNGLFAIFSEVVDNFLVFGMTEQEAVSYCIEKCGSVGGKFKFQAGVDDLSYTLQKGSGVDRWLDCLYIIGNLHGEEEEVAAEVLAIADLEDDTIDDGLVVYATKQIACVNDEQARLIEEMPAVEAGLALELWLAIKSIAPSESKDALTWAYSVLYNAV